MKVELLDLSVLKGILRDVGEGVSSQGSTVDVAKVLEGVRLERFDLVEVEDKSVHGEGARVEDLVRLRDHVSSEVQSLDVADLGHGLEGDGREEVVGQVDVCQVAGRALEEGGETCILNLESFSVK